MISHTFFTENADLIPLPWIFLLLDILTFEVNFGHFDGTLVGVSG